MKDFRLTEGHDWDIRNYKYPFVEKSDYVKQKLKQKLLAFTNEYFLAPESGIPYYEDILIKNPKLDRIEQIYILQIQSIEEVEEIISLNLSYNIAEEKLIVNFVVRDIYSNILELII